MVRRIERIILEELYAPRCDARGRTFMNAAATQVLQL
jgi:hypothetical protein